MMERKLILSQMFMSNFHQAFKFEYPGLAGQLLTPVIIYPELDINEVKFNNILSNSAISDYQFIALWDTGANCSCIKPEAAKKIGIDKNIVKLTEVTGVNSKTELKPIYKVGALILPNRTVIPNFHFVESNIASTADMIIGMDVILAGDFAICNHGGTTTFSFSIPCHENKINLVERSEKINERLAKKKFKNK